MCPGPALCPGTTRLPRPLPFPSAVPVSKTSDSLSFSFPGSVTLKPWSPGLSSSSSSDSVWPLGKPEGILGRGYGLDLLNRYAALWDAGAGFG